MPPAARTAADQVVGRRAHPPQRPGARQRDPLVGQGDLGQRPALTPLADQVAGGKPDLVEEDLVEGVGAGHVDQRADGDPGSVHRADEVRDPLVLRARRARCGPAGSRVGLVGVAGPHLLALDHPLVAVELGPGGQRRQVGAGAGLAEQLAPDLLGGQQRQQVALLLLVGAGVEDGRTGPADPDGVLRSADPGPPQLLVDHELDGSGSAPRPHGAGQWGATSPRSASWRPVGSGWSANQRTELGPAGDRRRAAVRCPRRPA